MTTISNIFKSLLPKDKKFFPLFKQFSVQVELCSKLYFELLNTQDLDKRKEILDLIQDSESKGDEICKSIIFQLTENFITPFDREEIHLLASNLDNILDDFLIAAKKIVKYNIGQIPEDLIELSDNICICSGYNSYCLNNLISHSNKDFFVSMRSISDLKEVTDEIFLSGMMNVYSSGLDQSDVLKIREVFLATDDIMRNFQKISFTLNQIVIKNS